MTEQQETENEAVRMLKLDHKKVQDLMFHYEQSEVPSHKLSFAETALNEIIVHTVIEEECIYPLLEQVDSLMETMVQQSRKDRDSLNILMAHLTNKEYDAEFESLFARLKEWLVDHIEDEECNIFPQLERVAPAELADQISKLKNELNKQDFPDQADFTPQVLLFERLKNRRHSA